jgi:hypothetical protein
MKRTFVFCALGILVLGVVVAQTKNPVTVDLKVAPAQYLGPCPVTVKMTARITLAAAERVNARFITSAGQGTPSQTLTFSSPGSQDISGSLSFNASFKGWIAVELTPARRTLTPALPGKGLADKFISEKRTVSLTCQAASAPVITDVTFSCEGMPPSELDLHGSNFGSTQGTKKVRVDGTVSGVYHAWNDTFITCAGGPIVDPDKNYEFVIVDAANNPLSNVFSKKFKMCWYDVSPAQAQVGAQVLLRVFLNASSQGSYVVQLGTTIMPVVSWTGHVVDAEIRVTVPQVAPGTYTLGIFKGGVNVMKDRTFTVLP